MVENDSSLDIMELKITETKEEFCELEKKEIELFDNSISYIHML